MNELMHTPGLEPDWSESISVGNFIYETEFHKLKQPLFTKEYKIFLVTNGSGSLLLNGKSFPLFESCVFFVYAGTTFELSGTSDFEYMYISFTGEALEGMLESFNISEDEPVYYNLASLKEFWFSSHRRARKAYYIAITKGTLFYTISFLTPEHKNPDFKDKEPYALIFSYINAHYTELDFCLKKVAYTFSYTPKYLSAVFYKEKGLCFKDYLAQKRINHALSLIERDDLTSISEIACLSGFSDPLYFSKVFKKITKYTPSDFIAEHKKKRIKTERVQKPH